MVPTWALLCNKWKREQENWRYTFILDSLQNIEACEGDTGTGRDLIEPDIYTKSLLDWANSNLNRIGYCDEAIEEFEPKGLVSIIQYGQLLERLEVYDIVSDWYEDQLESEVD